MGLPPLDIPHHFQKTDHTCGPASLRMVFDSLWGATLPEAELADWLATDIDTGTRQRTIEGLVRRFGLSARSSHTETTIDDLRELLRCGHVIMVLYHLEAETTDHYAVVKRITDDEVVLNDPWLGPDVCLTTEDFEAMWVSKDDVPGRKDRWALAVRDRLLSHGHGSEDPSAPGQDAASAS